MKYNQSYTARHEYHYLHNIFIKRWAVNKSWHRNKVLCFLCERYGGSMFRHFRRDDGSWEDVVISRMWWLGRKFSSSLVNLKTPVNFNKIKHMVTDWPFVSVKEDTLCDMVGCMREQVGLVHQMPYICDRTGFPSILEKVRSYGAPDTL